ncbi:DUF3040 domain-containing protein [Geodermatophilus poikilotrophus]|uniref:DUF3040 domain-containing protein n=1 Tax=Geodermatophilus poikilotrophus TaxID=1333667 RepID=A0A1I0GG22_9ACTN|nr:DUF3040 domain-containing protein [Geodermatophilus poikilotrophus]SET69774.1 Protein of unknown function [Geodermatophilus poikilotrophus]
MDDDAVLRALGEDLARTDPDLAARLTAGPGVRTQRPGHGALWVLVLGALVAVAVPFLVGPAAFGVMALVVLLGCPIVISHCLPSTADGQDDDPPSWSAGRGADP